jgi:hypothetical protein
MCAKFQAKSLSESKSPGGGQTDRQTEFLAPQGFFCVHHLELPLRRSAVQKLFKQYQSLEKSFPHRPPL